MDKSIHTYNHKAFIALLRSHRRAAGLTQVELADRLGETQVFVSKCERGERRIDLVETMEWCRAIGVPFASFASQLDDMLQNGPPSLPHKKPA
ncbi:helix-turn-helix domain-containing protein [Comamonas thiooxydans]|uniref:helix-turn-helix domain-containing protein n=1 Tax=Comamonas thiooxydans TaxID=363952 RepID=UPI000B407295|nr:helix-turn-helix transcriptional regulator [Comamonas thiooxydans]